LKQKQNLTNIKVIHENKYQTRAKLCDNINTAELLLPYEINTNYKSYRLCSLDEECFNDFASSCLFGWVSFILKNVCTNITGVQQSIRDVQDVIFYYPAGTG